MTSLPPISVTAQGQTTTILVRPGLLDVVGAEIRARTPAAKALVITDSTVGPLYLLRLETSLRAANFQVISHMLPAGEKNKHLETLLPAFTIFLNANIDRGTPLIALGGGVTGDMAGLCAALLLRGLPLIQVPTTLMAMVDSAIGGKTAVNHSAGKNLIGAFHQPLLVLSDPELLRSLPQAEISNGLAECIKHDAIRDPAHFARLPEILPKALANDTATLAQLVHHNASIKARVVTEDPLEHGVRAHLNLGHTFAHAFEIVTDHAISHGTAVGLGLIAAARLSAALGLLPASEAEVILRAVDSAGLPSRLSMPLDINALIAAMQRDKKVEHGHLRFILVEGLGRPVIHKDISETLVRQILATLGAV